MDKFSKLILSNGTDKITIEPIIKGIKHRGYRVVEPNLEYLHRRGLQPQIIETEFEDYGDVERYVDEKSRKGFEILAIL